MNSGGPGDWRSRGRREVMPKPVSQNSPSLGIYQHVGWLDVLVDEPTSVEPAKYRGQGHGKS